MAPRPRKPLLAWLLIAALLLVAVAPPAGLEVCVGEDGHIHIGVGEFEAGPDGIECICVDTCMDEAEDACACFEESHGHKDFGIDSIALMQRDNDGRSTFVLPDAQPAPDFLMAAFNAVEEDAQACAFEVVRERPPQWPSAQRSLVLRS